MARLPDAVPGKRTAEYAFLVDDGRLRQMTDDPRVDSVNGYYQEAAAGRIAAHLKPYESLDYRSTRWQRIESEHAGVTWRVTVRFHIIAPPDRQRAAPGEG
jgi:hypothetical protein